MSSHSPLPTVFQLSALAATPDRIPGRHLLLLLLLYLPLMFALESLHLRPSRLQQFACLPNREPTYLGNFSSKHLQYVANFASKMREELPDAPPALMREFLIPAEGRWGLMISDWIGWGGISCRASPLA